MDTQKNLTNGVFIIAEIAQAHDGSLGILHSFIDAVAKAGVDAIKFQTHIAEAESSIYEPFRINFSFEDLSRYDYWKRMEFTQEQWQGIKEHCDRVGLEFMSSPFSCAAVDYLENVGIGKYKIGSGEVSNFLMLEKVARTGKEIILSSGMSSYKELDDTVRFLLDFNASISILQCTTKYPTPAQEMGLNVITELKKRYGLQIGLSDHSGTIYPSMAAVALGAEIIEVHVTFDKRLFGPDTTSSLTIDELQQLVNGVRFLEKSFQHPVDKNDILEFKPVKKIFEKSLAVNKDLPAGHVLCFEDLESKKSAGQGIPAKSYRQVLGKVLKAEKKKYDLLSDEDI